jgi:nucleotide-binding universal stress UspA family protein
VKILLAIDDSKYSEAAIDAVITQAKPSETEVRLLHVVEPTPVYSDGQAWVYYPDYGEVRHEQRKEAEGLVARAAERLRTAGLRVTTAIETGNPKVVVIDDAAAWHADLIVLGSHGRKGLDRFLMGSVSDAVARHARCSVQIVRAHGS